MYWCLIKGAFLNHENFEKGYSTFLFVLYIYEKTFREAFNFFILMYLNDDLSARKFIKCIFII